MFSTAIFDFKLYKGMFYFACVMKFHSPKFNFFRFFLVVTEFCTFFEFVHICVVISRNLNIFTEKFPQSQYHQYLDHLLRLKSRSQYHTLHRRLTQIRLSGLLPASPNLDQAKDVTRINVKGDQRGRSQVNSKNTKIRISLSVLLQLFLKCAYIRLMVWFISLSMWNFLTALCQFFYFLLKKQFSEWTWFNFIQVFCNQMVFF